MLGIAADLDPKGYETRSENGSPEAAFDASVMSITGYLTEREEPLRNAIDHGAITAAVHAHLPLAGGNLKVYTTSQPQASIKRGLQKAGFRPVSTQVHVLTKPGEAVELTAVALRDDGLVVVGETADVVSGVLLRTVPDPRLAPMRRLIDATRGERRLVHNYVKLPNQAAPCIRRVAGGQRFEPGNPDEDLVLELSGEPRASEVTLGERPARTEILLKRYRVSDVSRDGQLLTLKVRTPAAVGPRTNAAHLAQDSYNVDLLYRCPGAAAARARRAAQKRRDELPDPTPPDRTGSALETQISAYIILGTGQPPPAVRVRCPIKVVPPGTKVLRCTGTRRRKGRLCHYKIKVNLGVGRIESLNVDTPDDKTGEIVSEEDKKPTGHDVPARRTGLLGGA